MLEWFETVGGPAYAPALMWTALALLALVAVLLAIRVFRSLTFGTFVAGGRNRKARLAVMDATAVDSQRRLVLVRRDDVEHLILIGGTNDVVVERDIHITEQAAGAPPRVDRPAPAAERRVEPVEKRRPAATEAKVVPMPPPAARAEPRIEPETEPRPAPGDRPAAIAPSPEPAVAESSRAVSTATESPAIQHPQASPLPATPVRDVPEVPTKARPEPAQGVPEHASPQQTTTSPESGGTESETRATTTSPAGEAQPAPQASAFKPSDSDLDDALLQELELTLEGERSENLAQRNDPQLDDEMERLLGELSEERR